MRITIAAAVLLLALGGCASSASDSSGPNLGIHLEQASGVPDMFYFRGPINLQYRLTVANPTATPVTLRRLDLRTIGPGAYSIRTGSTPITQTIAPNGTTSVVLSAWGRATGGYLSSEEPVTLRGVAYFDTPDHHAFVRQFVETFRP
jgi:hypothetical protein